MNNMATQIMTDNWMKETTNSRNVGADNISSPVEFKEIKTSLGNSLSRRERSFLPDSFVIYALGMVIY